MSFCSYFSLTLTKFAVWHLISIQIQKTVLNPKGDPFHILHAFALCYVLRIPAKVKTNVWNYIRSSFDRSLLSYWQSGKSGEHESLSGQFLSLPPQESQPCLACENAAILPLPYCMLSFFVSTFHRQSAIPLMPFPGFIYHRPREPIQWKYTVGKLIKSSCPL